MNAEQKTILGVIGKVARKSVRPEQWCTPEEWSERGENHGLGSVLVVIHDGGNLARFFSYDHEDYRAIDRMDKALEAVGYYSEQMTTWYSAIFPIQPPIIIP
jgi:hypothetical protein